MASSWACSCLKRILYWLVISSDKDEALKAGQLCPVMGGSLPKKTTCSISGKVQLGWPIHLPGQGPLPQTQALISRRHRIFPGCILRGSRIKGDTESTSGLLGCTMPHLPLPPCRPSAAPVIAPPTSHEKTGSQTPLLDPCPKLQVSEVQNTCSRL